MGRRHHPSRHTRLANPRQGEAATVPLLGLALAFPSRMGTNSCSIGLRFDDLSDGFGAVTQAAHRELRLTGGTLVYLSKRSAVMSDYEPMTPRETLPFGRESGVTSGPTVARHVGLRLLHRLGRQHRHPIALSQRSRPSKHAGGTCGDHARRSGGD
jgi:hypothetical protein